MPMKHICTKIATSALTFVAVLALGSYAVLAQDSGSTDESNTIQTLSGAPMAVPVPTVTNTPGLSNTALQTCEARKALLASYLQCLHKRLAGHFITADILAVGEPPPPSPYSLTAAWAACNMNDLYKTQTTTGDSGGTVGDSGGGVNPPCCKAGDAGGTVYPGGSDCTPGTPGYNPNATDCGTNAVSNSSVDTSVYDVTPWGVSRPVGVAVPDNPSTVDLNYNPSRPNN